MREYDIESLEKISFNQEKIGVMLLESITSGLYKDPKNSIREYIQNEYDAGATEIRIEIDSESISIIGNSEGMDDAQIETATDIGRSSKKTGEDVGFRGIGIWSGIAICEEVAIFTKRKGEVKGRVLIIDGKGILQDMKDPTKSLVSSLSTRVFLSKPKVKEKTDNKGTHVQLNRIYPHLQIGLNSSEIERFVQQILPVKISPNYSGQEIIEEALTKNVPNYRTMIIKVNNAEVYRPPFNNRDLSPPQFFQLPREDPIAYGWYSISGGVLPIDTRFMIFKQLGFTIGDYNRATLLDNIQIDDIVAARWITGEIHVIDDNIRPTSERNDFESGVGIDNLRDELSNLFVDLLRKVRVRSYSQSAEKRLQQINSLLRETPKDQQEIVSTLAEAERLLVLAEGDTSRGRLPKSRNTNAQRTIRSLKDKKEELIRQLGAPIEDRPREESKDPKEEKPKRKEPEVKTGAKSIKKKPPVEYITGLQGVYPWRPSDLKILILVIESMQKTFKDKDINRWVKAFERLLKEKQGSG